MVFAWSIWPYHVDKFIGLFESPATLDLNHLATALLGSSLQLGIVHLHMRGPIGGGGQWVRTPWKMTKI